MLFLLMILNMYLPLGNWLIFQLYNRCIQSPVKHLRQSFFDIWLGSELPLLIYTGKKHYIWFQTALAHLNAMLPSKRDIKKKQSIDVLCKLTATSYMVWILTVKEPKKMQSRKFKGALSGLAKVLAAESPLKMITFYFTSKALFHHKIFKSFSWPFGHVEKRLE